MTEIIVAILGSGLLTTVITNLFQIYKDGKKEDDGLKNGVRALLYERIKNLCQKYIRKGEVSINDWEDLKDLHKVYHDELDGNGFLDSLMAQVGSLKMTADR